MSVLFLWIALFRTSSWKAHGAFLAASVALVGGLGLVAPLPESLGERWLLVGLVFVGLESLGWAVRELGAGRRDRATLFLLGWIAAALLYNLSLMPFGSARYLLPALPPLLMLLCIALGRAPAPPRALLPAALGLAVCFGGFAAVSDYRLANHYRAFAGEVEGRLAARSEGRTWFIVEWGMRHYLEQASASYLPARSNRPEPGDLVIVPEMPRFWAPSPPLQARLEPRRSRPFDSDLPVKLFHRRSGAGFYCHLWGLLPFSISEEEDETFTIFLVAR